MATITTVLPIESFGPVPGAALPELKSAGSSIAALSYSFDAGADEAIQRVIPRAVSYGSGNITVRVLWYGDTATSGDVVFGASIAAITPNTDTQDAETDSWATENTVTDSHLGTTAHRLHEASITVSNLDSLADGDYLALRIRRLGTSGSDTMSGDAQVVGVVVEWSDT